MLRADLSKNVKWHWQALGQHRHEMSLHNERNRVHPLLEYQVDELDSDKMYAMSVHFDQTDEIRYDPHSGELKPYLEANDTCAEANRDPQIAWHKDGVQSGRVWMEAPFGFKNLRITHKEEYKEDFVILLRRFHCYTPVLTIYEVLGCSKIAVIKIKLDGTNFITVRQFSQKKELLELKGQINIDTNALRKKYKIDGVEDGGAPNENEEDRGGNLGAQEADFEDLEIEDDIGRHENGNAQVEEEAAEERDEHMEENEHEEDDNDEEEDLAVEVYVEEDEAQDDDGVDERDGEVAEVEKEDDAMEADRVQDEDRNEEGENVQEDDRVNESDGNEEENAVDVRDEDMEENEHEEDDNDEEEDLAVEVYVEEDEAQDDDGVDERDGEVAEVEKEDDAMEADRVQDEDRNEEGENVQEDDRVNESDGNEEENAVDVRDEDMEENEHEEDDNDEEEDLAVEVYVEEDEAQDDDAVDERDREVAEVEKEDDVMEADGVEGENRNEEGEKVQEDDRVKECDGDEGKDAVEEAQEHDEVQFNVEEAAALENKNSGDMGAAVPDVLREGDELAHFAAALDENDIDSDNGDIVLNPVINGYIVPHTPIEPIADDEDMEENEHEGDDNDEEEDLAMENDVEEDEARDADGVDERDGEVAEVEKEDEATGVDRVEEEDRKKQGEKVQEDDGVRENDGNEEEHAVEEAQEDGEVQMNVGEAAALENKNAGDMGAAIPDVLREGDELAHFAAALDENDIDFDNGDNVLNPLINGDIVPHTPIEPIADPRKRAADEPLINQTKIAKSLFKEQREEFSSSEATLLRNIFSTPEQVAEQHINGFTSPGFPLTTEDKVKQKKIKLESPSSPQTYSRHLPDNFVDEPHVNGSASPTFSMEIKTGEKIDIAKLMIPSSSNTDFRRLPVDVVEEPSEKRSTNPVPQLTKDVEVKQKTPQKHSHRISHYVSYEPLKSDSTTGVAQTNMGTGENQRRDKFENPDVPQTNSRRLPDSVASESPVNSFISPVHQRNMKSGGNRKKIRVENSGSSQTNSHHLADNAVGEPSVNRFTSRASQLDMDTGVKPKKIKLKTTRSQTKCHISHTVTYEPLVNGPNLTVPQEKKRTGAKQMTHQNSLDTPQHMPHTMIPPTSSFNISGTFSPISSFLPGAFSSQRPPIQAPNFADYPYPGMQPNLNQLAMYHHVMSSVWPNYQNLHSINSQVPLLPPANSFTLPNPLMTPHQNLIYPTTSHQNMIPNNQTPHFNNFQVPLHSSTNGFDPFHQSPQGNSAQEHIPNPERSSDQEN